MSKVPYCEEGGVFFVTLTVVGWTDIFIRQEYRDEIIANLNFCIQRKGLRIYSFCLMTNHLHMIASCQDGHLNKLLRDFKSFTAKKIMQVIQENPKESRKKWIVDRLTFLSHIRHNDAQYQFWERDNYPEQILSDHFYLQKESYIHLNPVRAGFVLSPEDWLHSSASPDCPLAIQRDDSHLKKAG
jgi:putative transposase